MWVKWISCNFLILYLCFMIIIVSFYSCFLSFCVVNIIFFSDYPGDRSIWFSNECGAFVFGLRLWVRKILSFHSDPEKKTFLSVCPSLKSWVHIRLNSPGPTLSKADCHWQDFIWCLLTWKNCGDIFRCQNGNLLIIDGKNNTLQ